MKGSVSQTAVATMTPPPAAQSGGAPHSAGPRILSLHSWMRLAAVLSVVLLAIAIRPHKTFATFVLVFSSVHYTLAALYGRHRIAQALSSPREAFGLVAFALAGVLLFLGRGDLFVLFGIHHVLNEVYLLYRTAGEGLLSHTRWLRVSAIVLNSVVYVAILRHTWPASLIDETWLFVTLAASCVFFFSTLVVARKSFRDTPLLDLCLFEVLGLLAFVASFFVHITLLHVVMYHFVFWSFYPVQAMARKGMRPVIQYACLNALLTVFFFVTSPLSPLPFRVSNAFFYEQFRLWSMLHIMTSFNLSAAHPVWMRRLLQQRPLALSGKTG